MGEASASQLRYWSNAIPSIVSDVGWYSELHDNVVMKVSPAWEQEDLISVLEKIISGNQLCFECGINGYRYLNERHSVQGYIDGLAEYLRYVNERRFIASIFDDRLINIMASMCNDVEDSRMFEGALAKLSGMPP